MAKKTCRFPESWIRQLIQLTDGMLSPEAFEVIVTKLEEEASNFYFNKSAEANLLRIFTSIYDRTFFFRELPKFPHHGEILVAIAASSNYLTDIIVRHPEYLYQLFDHDFLTTQIDYGSLLKEASEGTKRFSSFTARLNYLRQFKQRYILKIGTNDILHFDELIDTTRQLSFLAKVINDILFQLCLEEIQQKYKLTKNNRKYCLCSLGKLGGGELNYSSDVDLILFYDGNTDFPSIKKDYHEILSETVQLFSKSSTELTSNGYIYRTDFRLRPDGKYSPVCKAMDDYIKYYETRGEDWERQMLIKLDLISGDFFLYQNFISFVIPYVYRSYHSSTIKEKIKMMKQNIERLYSSKDDVKAFIGGIRDIEFAIQALQLLNGGKYSELRTGNSLIGLEILEQRKLISKKEKATLSVAYIFYRRIEHFLQLMNDTQTHVIPDDEELISKLAVYLELKSVTEFKNTLEKYRAQVRSIYELILKSESNNTGFDSELIKYQDRVKAEKNLQFLRSGQGIIERKEFDSRTIELFNSIEPVLNQYLKSSAFPDRVLENFVRVIRGSSFISIWYGELTNKKFFENFLYLCEYGQKSIDLLSDSNELSDYFLSRKVFVKNLREEFGELSLKQLLLALSTQFTLGLTDTEKISARLSEYVAYAISKTLQELNFRYKYFVAGLGSFGASSMNFSSDIDLIVVAENVEINDKIQSHFQDFLLKIQQKLKPFEVDFRLRPEGKKSPLVWDLKNYAIYLNSRARIWEFQSLSKLNFVFGNQDLFNEFKSVAVKKISTLQKSDIKEEIRKMHAVYLKQNSTISEHTVNIKKQRGGLTTLDFVIQFELLKNPKLLSKLQGTNYSKIMNALKKVIPVEDMEIISSNRLALRKIEFLTQCLYNSSGGLIPDSLEKLSLLNKFLNKPDSENFRKEIRSILKTNAQLFEKYIGV